MPERAGERLEVSKTFKLFIGGAFPRSESGRTLAVEGVGGKVLAHVSRASRKDLREAVEAATRAQGNWAGMTAYNRGQVLYRMAEMMEGKRGELVEAVRAVGGKKGGGRDARPAREVEAAIDRMVCFGGWADKYAQVLGCNNPVAGPYYNFTVPEPTGVVGVIAPDEWPLLGLVSLMAPALCAGNAVVALGSGANPLPTAIMGEVCATSDVPAGAVNLLTGVRAELAEQFASHREIGAIHAAGVPAEEMRVLREGAAGNVKRVLVREERHRGARASRGQGPMPVDFLDDACSGPWWIEPFVEFKTMWHPSGV
jgi:acyl-CoA reductase-like NAD-dependent aldehyde dehydrogenase